MKRLLEACVILAVVSVGVAASVISYRRGYATGSARKGFEESLTSSLFALESLHCLSTGNIDKVERMYQCRITGAATPLYVYRRDTEMPPHLQRITDGFLSNAAHYLVREMDDNRGAMDIEQEKRILCDGGVDVTTPEMRQHFDYLRNTKEFLNTYSGKE